MGKYFIAIFSLFILLQTGYAQFGKNKIQYKNFDWHYIQSKHFDVYYYQGGEKLAEFAAEVAEEASEGIGTIEQAATAQCLSRYTIWRQDHLVMHRPQCDSFWISNIFSDTSYIYVVFA